MSIKYTTKQIQAIDKITCDLCGSNCTQENALLSADWGYSSKKDGIQHRINFCENCFDVLVDWIRNKRYPSIFTTTNDPLNGSH